MEYVRSAYQATISIQLVWSATLLAVRNAQVLQFVRYAARTTHYQTTSVSIVIQRTFTMMFRRTARNVQQIVWNVRLTQHVCSANKVFTWIRHQIAVQLCRLYYPPLQYGNRTFSIWCLTYDSQYIIRRIWLMPAIPMVMSVNA